MFEQASFIVGLPELYDDIDYEIWGAIHDYTKLNPDIGLEDPYNVFDTMRHLGTVSLEEARRFQKTSSVWPVVAGNCILIEQVSVSTPAPELPPRKDASLNRPTQLQFKIWDRQKSC